MELSWLQSLLLGLVSGFTEILPVSGQAHRLVILKLLGSSGEPAVLRLFIHGAVAGALYFCCHGQLLRMLRALRLSRIPKKRRKRPLDMDAMADLSLLRTALIPVILSLFFYSKAQSLSGNLMFLAGFLFLNGLIQYIPQYLPGANKESGAMTRVDGLAFGLGGALAVLPGISCIGATVSIGSVRGMDLKKALNLALLMNIPVNIAYAIFDLIALVGAGAGSLSFGALFAALLAAVAAFGAVVLAVRLLQKIAGAIGYSVFGFYSWGAALLTFILYLMAV